MCDTATGERGRLPDFLIIGAAKSGTSTLYQRLSGHPQIYMSPINEPCFFDTAVAWHKGLLWYRSLFANASPGQICGEASTNYSQRVDTSHTPQPMEENTRKLLLERYAASGRALSELAGFGLSHWLN